MATYLELILMTSLKEVEGVVVSLAYFAFVLCPFCPVESKPRSRKTLSYRHFKALKMAFFKLLSEVTDRVGGSTQNVMLPKDVFLRKESE